MNYCMKFGEHCELANQMGECSITACSKQVKELNSTTITISTDVKASLGTGCIICNETILLSDEEELMLRSGYSIHSKVCDKCKNAILHMRELIGGTNGKIIGTILS